MNLPVRECKFISCVAYGKNTDYETNTAAGGGLMYLANDHTLGISNSLFAHCESKCLGGGISFVINKVVFRNIFRFCFYHENIAPQGRNAFIRFNQTDEEPWDVIFYHSFTSDGDLDNSLVHNSSEVTEDIDSWLPKGIKSFNSGSRRGPSR